MLIDISQTNPLDVYRLLISLVTPRPIAWVTSIDAEGRVNLAPFSFFNVFGADPPVVVFAPNRKPDRSKKDTLNNVESMKEFVINAAVAELAAQVNLSSAALPPGESEVELTGLSVVPSMKVKPPRLAESPVNLECVLRQVVPVGENPLSANLVIGEVVMIHVQDRVLDDRGRVDPRKLGTIARLGADFYCHTSDLFQMKRPE
ncbi:MAG TPA: flavin reductase family protein [Planctomycetaceae bacterium]|nr:flavin reductase family protein [Planctomycetaceae bacterium]